MVGGRSLSRGHYDVRPPPPFSDDYGGTPGSAMAATRSAMKEPRYKSSSAGGGGGVPHYLTPVRSSSRLRSASRGRYDGRGSGGGGDYDYQQSSGARVGGGGASLSHSSPGSGERRDAYDEPRHYASSYRPSSAVRERFADERRDEFGGGTGGDHHRDFGAGDAHSVGDHSAARARETLSRLRSGGTSSSRRPSPYERDGPPPSPYGGSRGDDRRTSPYDAERLESYVVKGLQDELDKRESEAAGLRRDMDEMRSSYEEEMASVRSKLVSTFKEDMQEMKTEWEDAYTRLKEEGEASRLGLEKELAEVNRAKNATEGESERIRQDLDRARKDLHARLAEEKARSKELMDGLRKSKEEDLERLRAMYEEHLESTKVAASNVESELKDELRSVLEENERVKVCYEQLESEADRAKSDLDQLNSKYQRAVSDAGRYEADISELRREVEACQNENEKKHRKIKQVEDDLGDARDELNAMTSSYQRAKAEGARYQREYDRAEREGEELKKRVDEVSAKLDSVQEERALESRYAEALVKQRDNMTAIIENGQSEIEELKSLNADLSKLVAVAQEYGVDPTANSLRNEIKQGRSSRERVETLTRERERYNATVKALKVDLKALHQQPSVGPETSLQEHMRLLNEKWEGHVERLEGAEKLKSELEGAMTMIESGQAERDRMAEDHRKKVERVSQDLQETQTALVKMERDKLELNDKLTDYELSDAKRRRVEEELRTRIGDLEDRLKFMESERKEREAQRQQGEADRRSLQADLDKARSKRNELQDTIETMEEVKSGLKKKLEMAYYDLEEAQRDLQTNRQDHQQEMHSVELELQKGEKLQERCESQEDEIKALKEMIGRLQVTSAKDVEDAQTDVAESYKVKLRLMEEKHAESDRRRAEAIGEQYRSEIDGLKTSCRRLERAAKDAREALNQKTLLEQKRRGEFAKQKHEVETLRCKERHLEAHIAQLESHIEKTVADYESKLLSSGNTTCSSSSEKALRKQVRELEKKLEVSSAAMKQIGKSSLLLEKENGKLRGDKNELKVKLKKLVDCAEKHQGLKR